MKKRAVLALAFALAWSWAASPARACLWDRDTVATEAEGMEDVVWIIVGRFPRNPPLYYEMRLTRVAEELQANPDALALYDDAGVACDRLGRSGEAIDWMERKLARLEAMPQNSAEVREHRYRYLANVGTFWVHRWFHDGADRARIAEVEKARDFIKAAIELNPDAHFGREKYQLMALEWIIAPPEEDPKWPNRYKDFVKAIDIYYIKDEKLRSLELEKAVKGLAGLVALGNAWNSIDAFYSLKIVLSMQGKAFIAYAAQMRVLELSLEGRKSLLPYLADPEKSQKALENLFKSRGEGAVENPEQVIHFYRQARHCVEKWLEHRNNYMLSRLKQGLHPDTQPDFWDEYVEYSVPSIAELDNYSLSKNLRNDLREISLNDAIYLLKRVNPEFIPEPNKPLRLLSGFRVTRWEGLEKGPGGAKAEGMLTVMDLGNEEKCYEELRRVLWPGGKAICPKCGSDHTVKNGHKKKESARQRYKCKECESRFDDLTGTVFAKRHKPLTVWLTCLYLMSLNQSTEQIKNDLGLCRSDAQDMAQALRQAIVDKRPEIIVRGEVECDEVYIVAGHKGKPEEVKKKTDAGAGAGSKGGEGGEEWKRKSLQFLALFSEAAPSRYMFCQTFKSGEYCQ